ncbi:hypothetical protein ACWCQ0_50205 [Streptomyces massasporeus]
MSHAIQDRPVATVKRASSLSSARLPRWSPIAIAAGSIAAGIVGAVVAVPLVSVVWSVHTALRDARAARAEAGTAPTDGDAETAAEAAAGGDAETAAEAATEGDEGTAAEGGAETAED